MRKIVISLFVSFVLIMLSSCSKSIITNYEINNYSDLFGKDFLFCPDSVAFEPDVQFPTDQIDASEYVFTNIEIIYNISISENGETLLINYGEISAELDNENDHVYYNISEGLVAGGRFVIKRINDQLNAEYTIYGSGIPIIKSEKGNIK